MRVNGGGGGEGERARGRGPARKLLSRFPTDFDLPFSLVLPSPLPLILQAHCMDTRLKYVQLEGAIYLHTVSGLTALHQCCCFTVTFLDRRLSLIFLICFDFVRFCLGEVR